MSGKGAVFFSFFFFCISHRIFIFFLLFYFLVLIFYVYWSNLGKHFYAIPKFKQPLRFCIFSHIVDIVTF
jgi:peptidoglycan biosynthesis protein MviN/MurJ (putative lipid II flippase)